MPEHVLAPISCGELIDKITILELKTRHIKDAAKRRNVDRELALLAALWEKIPGPASVAGLADDLRAVNGALWEVEDALRGFETAGSFGPEFVAAARSVYKLNDRRAALKRAVNLATGSDLVEEKSYGAAGDPGGEPGTR